MGNFGKILTALTTVTYCVSACEWICSPSGVADSIFYFLPEAWIWRVPLNFG